MADLKNTVTITMGYEGTDFQRKIKFDGVADSIVSDVKDKCKAINASLAAGTDGGLGEFFRADTYAAGASATIGTFNAITAAQIDSVEIEYINLNV